MTHNQLNALNDLLAQKPELQSQLNILECLQQLATNNDISITKLSKIIAEEPQLGAKLIKLANASRPKQTIYTISQAIMHLGADSLCQNYKNLILDSLSENHKALISCFYLE
ncbi:MAG: HDOD domain-containing protein [Deltaproteobacteria bacterium]|nr:HDOD domain-containing protein [Deltaproteobacteria bacterium]